MSLACVLGRLRSRRGRACVLGVVLALLTLVPLAHAGPPDPVSIAGIYAAGDFDEVVSTLIGADTVSPPVRPTATAPLRLVSVLTGVGASSVVAVVTSTVLPRSPPRI